MKHEMKLALEPFDMIADGRKTIELRLYDDKRKKIKLGDEIQFICIEPSHNTLNATVIGLHRYNSFLDTTMNLYYRSCPHLADYEGADVTEGLLDTALKKGDLFLFYVEDSIDFETGVEVLFKTPPQYFFQYIDKVNASLKDYSIDTSNIGYYSFEKTRLIAVELHYL